MAYKDQYSSKGYNSVQHAQSIGAGGRRKKIAEATAPPSARRFSDPKQLTAEVNNLRRNKQELAALRLLQEGVKRFPEDTILAEMLRVSPDEYELGLLVAERDIRSLMDEGRFDEAYTTATKACDDFPTEARMGSMLLYVCCERIRAKERTSELDLAPLKKVIDRVRPLGVLDSKGYSRALYAYSHIFREREFFWKWEAASRDEVKIPEELFREAQTQGLADAQVYRAMLGIYKKGRLSRMQDYNYTLLFNEAVSKGFVEGPAKEVPEHPREAYKREQEYKAQEELESKQGSIRSVCQQILEHRLEVDWFGIIDFSLPSHLKNRALGKEIHELIRKTIPVLKEMIRNKHVYEAKERETFLQRCRKIVDNPELKYVSWHDTYDLENPPEKYAQDAEVTGAIRQALDKIAAVTEQNRQKSLANQSGP